MITLTWIALDKSGLKSTSTVFFIHPVSSNTGHNVYLAPTYILELLVKHLLNTYNIVQCLVYVVAYSPSSTDQYSHGETVNWAGGGGGGGGGGEWYSNHVFVLGLSIKGGDNYHYAHVGAYWYLLHLGTWHNCSSIKIMT